MQQAEMITGIGKVEVYSEYNHDEWLALRHQDVTASKIGALFGCHDYSSELQLYAEKCQLKPQSIADNGPLRRGRWFEAAAFEALPEFRPGWTEITRSSIYIRDPENRIGCTPDGTFVDENGEFGVAQVKTLSRQKWREEWRADGDEIKVPFWITLQAFVEATLMNASKAAIVAFLADEFNPDMAIVEFDCPANTYPRITKAAARFWNYVNNREAPPADYAKDGDAIAMLYTGSQPVLDLTGDDGFAKLLAQRDAIVTRRKAAEEEEAEIKARIVEGLRDAEAVLCGDHYVTYKLIERAGFTVKPTSYRKLSVGKRPGEGGRKRRK